MAEKIR